jgi:glucokinase
MPLFKDPRIAVDIGASHVRVAVSDGPLLTEVVEDRVADLEARYDGDLIAAVEETIAKVAAVLPGDAGWFPAIGVGVASVVDEYGSLRAPLGRGIPPGTALRDRLAARFHTSVVVDNDASLAALGEAVHGVGQGEQDLVLITLGTNIGMGIVAGGTIYRGARGAAGEVGTLPVPLSAEDTRAWGRVRAERPSWAADSSAPDGYVWLEELYGGKALARALAEAQDRDAPATEPTAADRVLLAAAAGDPSARAIVDRAIHAWAAAIATVCNVLDPGVVVLGGGISDDLPPFLPRLREEAARFLPQRCPPIEMSALGPVAGLIGAGVAARGVR